MSNYYFHATNNFHIWSGAGNAVWGSGLHDFSYCLWFNSNTGDVSSPWTLLEIPVLGTEGANYFAIQLIDNGVYPGIWGAIFAILKYGTHSPPLSVTLTSLATVCDNNWHLITVTCERGSATGFKLYIDAVLNVTGDATVGQSLNLNGAGEIEGGTDYGLDQFRFYGNLILDQTDIATIYNDGNGALVNPDVFATICTTGYYSEMDGFYDTQGQISFCIGHALIDDSWSGEYNLECYGLEVVEGGLSFFEEEPETQESEGIFDYE